MGILGRTVFREILSRALLGTALFTFVLFLRSAGKLFELLVRSSASPGTLAYLFALILPPALPFTVPVGVLVGILIVIGRMSSDGEIVAMRAAGLPSHRLLAPVAAFAIIGMTVAGAASLWLTPLATRETYRVLNRLAAEQLTAEIQPRVFEEQFPNRVLWVDDVIAGQVVQWRRVFMADLTPPGERSSEVKEVGDGPRITIAAEALAVPDLPNNRIQLSTIDSRSYEVGKAVEDYYFSGSPKGVQALEAQKPEEKHAKYPELDTKPLIREARKFVEARIELNQRFALPPACLVLALVALPLGIRSRKGGKSTAFVLTVALGFLYWTGMITFLGLAKQGKLPVQAAVWTPNSVFGLLGVVMLGRLERPGDRDWIGTLLAWGRSVGQWFSGNLASNGVAKRGVTNRLAVVPQIIDGYVLASFVYYFLIVLVSLALMTEVFTFFELLGDIVKNKIAMGRVITYLIFLAPKLIFDTTPISVQVAVLITFGVLAKNNEITAMKACGISLYRLSLPILIAAGLLSASLFAFDYYIVPGANLKQDALRNEIKAKPVQSFLRPDRRWIFGRGANVYRIYYYKYFDSAENVMIGLQVFDLDRASFRLRRHIAAEKARWEPSLGRWVFQNGWMRELSATSAGLNSFQGRTATFPELDEPPGYFLREVKQEKQMNFQQLETYIGELRQGGFDTVRLQVQYHKKFSVPLFALIMAALSIPFAFVAGNRGAMAGVGVSLGISMAYFAVGQLFEQIGNLGELPAQMAAWSPDALFALCALYFMLRMRT